GDRGQTQTKSGSLREERVVEAEADVGYRSWSPAAVNESDDEGLAAGSRHGPVRATMSAVEAWGG
ncbi:hypothetical protein E4U40_001394, partial [Claviceps sp. LM458 group G5]